MAGLVRSTSVQSIASLSVSATHPASEKIGVTAIVVPRVTCDLPLRPIPFDLRWNHLSNITLANPDFGNPGKVDLLLGVEVFVDVMLQGRRLGPSGSPIAFETKFGWVLAGNTDVCTSATHVATHHASLLTGDDILRKFWEQPMRDSALSPEERSVVQHFKTNHTRTDSWCHYPRNQIQSPWENPAHKPFEDSFRLNVRCMPRVGSQKLMKS